MREACRALRGSILRQETYALDNTDASDRPYSASERNYTIEVLQPKGPNQYGVFLFIHARPSITTTNESFTKLWALLLADQNAPPPGAQNAGRSKSHACHHAGDRPVWNVLHPWL